MANCSRRCSGAASSQRAAPWKKALVIVAVGGLVAAAKRFGPRLQGTDWEKRFERLPDNAPPKWMFTNIRTIRQNTDRILDLLEHERPDATASDVAGK